MCGAVPIGFVAPLSPRFVGSCARCAVITVLTSSQVHLALSCFCASMHPVFGRFAICVRRQQLAYLIDTAALWTPAVPATVPQVEPQSVVSHNQPHFEFSPVNPSRLAGLFTPPQLSPQSVPTLVAEPHSLQTSPAAERLTMWSTLTPMSCGGFKANLSQRSPQAATVAVLLADSQTYSFRVLQQDGNNCCG
jgi:hypothetical protein